MENLKVLKFGGGVLQNQRDIIRAADIINRNVATGTKVLAVVSAMDDTTDELLAKVGDKQDPRSIAMLLSTGEIQSAAYLANRLVVEGAKAKCFTGQQAGIITNDNFLDADILDIKTSSLTKHFQAGYDIAVVCGFQGLSEHGETTVLGRNGSDTTAFYLTDALSASSCTLYKDVDGIYNKNPKDNPDARLYRHLNYTEVFGCGIKGVICDKALALCEKMFSARDIELIIRNIDLSHHWHTTIGRKSTEFYQR